MQSKSCPALLQGTSPGTSEVAPIPAAEAAALARLVAGLHLHVLPTWGPWLVGRACSC